MNDNHNSLLGYTIQFNGHTYTVTAITDNCYLINRDGVLYLAAVRAKSDGYIDLQRDTEEYDYQQHCNTRRLRQVLHLRTRYDRIADSETIIEKIIKTAVQQ